MSGVSTTASPKLSRLTARAVLALVIVAGLGVALVPGKAIVAAQPAKWLPVPSQSLIIEPGSALDFSQLVPLRPAGSAGALTLGHDGLLRLGDEAAPRFNCAMLANGANENWVMPTHAESDVLARQLRVHGYNLVRFHFMDGRLAVGTPQGQDVNPENLDRYQYLLAALKKNGIYWMLDIVTSANGPKAKGYDTSRSVTDLKARVNYDPAARVKWLEMLEQVYTRPNPYTGAAPLADPALAFVIGANENSLGFWSQFAKDGPFDAALLSRFDHWTRERFPTVAELRANVPGLTPNEEAGRKPIAPPLNWDKTAPRMALFRAFVASLEIDTYQWMTHMLNERGYHGPVLGYPEWYSTSDNRTRRAMPITDLHAYVGGVDTYAIGSQYELPSITSNQGLAQLVLASSSRWRDRPLVLSEYGSPFPNPSRRDDGVAFPALASFQDYTTICRMASMTIETDIPDSKSGLKPIYPYRVGLDPVQRVTETLSTLLFFRGDVARARSQGVAIAFSQEDEARPGSAFVPATIGRVAFLVKFGLIPRDRIDSLPKGTQILSTDAERGSIWSMAVERVVAMMGGGWGQTTQLVSSLFAQGQLPAGNRTSVASGIYESETGEILLDQGHGRIAVKTPLTEALHSDSAVEASILLGSLSVTSTSTGALIAASALDGKPLRESKRILLMLVGDARNTDMVFAGGGTQGKLVSWGKLPITLQQVVAKITLYRERTFAGSLSPLALNGRPLTAQKVSGKGQTLALTLDTGAIPAAPTTFFLLESD